MAPDQQDAAQINSHRVASLYARSNGEILAGMLATVIVVGLGWKASNPTWLLAWAGLGLLIYVLRMTGAAMSSKRAHGSAKLLTFMAGLTGTALVWGAGTVLAAATGSTFFTAFVLFAVATVAIFVMALYAVVIPAVVSFTVLALALPAVYLLLGKTEFMAMGATACVFAAVLILQAFAVRKHSLEGMDLRLENQQLLSHLDTRREQIEQLRVALKTNTDKREKAESELRRTAADLGLAQGKARALADTLQRVSPMDPVSGLANRRRFDDALATEWRRAMREHKTISLLLLEIDEWEEYVKEYGAQAADVCLKRTARIINDHARRAGDLTARLDESKFGLILVGAEYKDASRIASEIRTAVAGMNIAFRGSKVADTVTAHIGMSTMTPGRNSSEKEMMERVDNALYEAKFKGGNTVVIYRALNKMRLERWEPKADGVLTETGLIQKLMVWGYDATRLSYPTKRKLPDENSNVDKVKAVLSGNLQLTIEGQSLVLKPGDCLFVPANISCSAEVLSDVPVVAFDGVVAAS